MTTLEQIGAGLAENKRRMVAAFHAGDDEELKRLSQEKEGLKKRRARYCACGSPKNRHKLRCYACYLRERFYARALAPALALAMVWLAGCSAKPLPHSSAIGQSAISQSSQMVKQEPVPPIPAVPSVAMMGSSEEQAARIVLHGCTNCPSPVQIVSNGVFYLTWDASPSSNVVYQIGETTNLAKPFFIAGATTNLWWKVYVTNSVMGLFKVRATNQLGFSRWAT